MKVIRDEVTKKVYTREEVEKSTLSYFKGDQLATTVWIDKYSLKNKVEEKVEYYELNPDMMHRRIAKEFARVEAKYKEPMGEEEIYHLLKNFEYIIPQGSPMAGIGNPFTNTSISNCFLIGNHPDSYGGIINADEEQVQLMKRRGGVGQSLDHLRPSGAIAGGVPLGESCGMTLYMDRYSNSTREVQQDGRRGALMLCVSIEHPDSEKFIDKKMTPGSVTGANVSLKISKEFMRCEKEDLPFIQTFPVDAKLVDIITDKQKPSSLSEDFIDSLEYNVLYFGKEVNGQKTYFKKVDAKKIWEKLCHNAWKSAEPGILFWDKIIDESPANFYGPEWVEKGTNPCFTGDTMVAVADGRGYVSFKELAEEGKDVEVYSEADNKVVTVKTMRNPHITAKAQKIFKITFIGGEFVRATKNHEFYLKNNTKVKLSELKKGEQLRVITRYKNNRTSGILNRDTRLFGDLPIFTIQSIKEDGIEDVYNGVVDMYHNFFVGNFKGKVDNITRLGSSLKTANCGEIPLPPDDSCRLLLLNLYGYVSNKFTKEAIFEDELFISHVNSAMRLMDGIVDLEIEKIDKIINEIDSKSFDKKFQEVEKNLWLKIRKKAVDGRRTGLGITGEGDMMAALGIKYGTAEGTLFSEKLHQLLATSAYSASIDLAEERGAFPLWDKNDIEQSGFLKRMFTEGENELMSSEIKEKYLTYGRRNIAILTIAPAGSVSILSQTTSGVEPAFSMWYFRKKKITNEKVWDYVDEVGDKWVEFPVFHKAFIDYYSGIKKLTFEEASEILSTFKDEELKVIFENSPYFQATSQDVDYVEKVRMQGAIQKWIDHSISVTVNMPESVTEQMVNDVYRQAFESGCKGVTVYRDNSRGNVMSSKSDKVKVEVDNLNYIHAVKRPKELNADVFIKTSRGEKFIIFVGKLDGKPYEIFAVNSTVDSKWKGVKEGILVKQGKGVYSFKTLEGKVLIQNLGDYMVETEQNSTRMLSSLLRHQVDPKFVAETIFKFATINSFHQVIGKVLQTYTNGEVKCPECKGKMVMSEGCKKCENCGFNACN